jgi:hypothetical protein
MHCLAGSNEQKYELRHGKGCNDQSRLFDVLETLSEQSSNQEYAFISSNNTRGLYGRWRYNVDFCRFRGMIALALTTLGKPWFLPINFE